MNDEERARTAVRLALVALADGDLAEANQLLAHAVHDGVQPVELVGEVVAQTGGTL